MRKKTETLTVSLTPGTKDLLDRLALKCNCTWGSQPNISLLIERISREEIPVGKPQQEIAQELVDRAIDEAIEILEEAIDRLENL